MSNTGNPFTSTSNHKENNHVMISRGGEKKVMKKILSVALSTAMAFSMFASVAFGQTGLTDVNAQYNYLKDKGIFSGFPDGQAHLDRQMTRAEFAKVITKTLGLKEVEGVYSFKDKNYGENHWAAPYVEAVYAAGIMEGVNSTKKIFGVSNPVTIQEMATVLVRALDLEVPTGSTNSASAWAKDYVQAAINAGLVDANANFQSNATRELLVGAAYAVDQELSLSVESYTVSEAGKVVEFKMTDGETVKVTLDKALEANKETEVKFTYQEKEFTEKVTYVVTTATKVESATASNYKQLVVTFDGEVDKASAENASNYTVTGVDFESATLSSDKKSVTLLVSEGSQRNLPVQTATNLKVNGVKNGDGSRTFNDVTLQFTVADTQLPTVQSVTGLGTGAVRVEFSEPVTRATAGNIANYRVDGNPISGSVTFSYPNVAIISTNLSVGEHSITAAGVTDFANFKVGAAATNFTVANDTAAPEIVSVTASDLNKVVVKFNEPVKSVSSAYHTSTSRSASVSISDDEVTLTFTEGNRLSLGQSTVYLNGVTDYSGNSADRNANVTPELDTVRPTVTSVSAKAEGSVTKITVEFSEAVNASDIANRSNFVLRNSKGEVFTGRGFSSTGNPTTAPSFVVNANGTTATNKVVLTTVGSVLPADTYKLEIAGIRDRAAIGNTLVPVTVEFSVTQAGAVQTQSAWYTVDSNNANTVFYVQFDRTVATSGTGNALDINKYDYVLDGTARPFPTSATIGSYTANTIQITVPTADVNSGLFDENVATKSIVVRNVADLNGNYVSANGDTVTLRDRSVSFVELADSGLYATAQDTIVAKFDGELSYVDKNDFNLFVDGSTTPVDKNTISVTNRGYADGVTTLEFKLNNTKLPYDLDGVEVTTVGQEAIKTVDTYGRQIKAVTTAVSVDDKIAPVIETTTTNGVTTQNVTATTGGTGGAAKISVQFTEALVLNATPSSFVLRVNGNTVTGFEATVAQGSDTLEVTLPTSTTVNAGDLVELELKGNATGQYLRDTNNNVAKDFSVSAQAE